MSSIFNAIITDTVDENTVGAGVNVGGVNLKSGVITYLNNVPNLKQNLAAIVDPTILDDSSQGYSVGSNWINTILNKTFTCINNAIGAAVWTQTNGAATGEVNTASNVGSSGVGVFKQKTGVNLEFKNVNAASSKITVTNNTGINTIDLDLPLAVSSATSTTTATTTSNTFVLITSMDILPGAGTYFVIFSGSGSADVNVGDTAIFALGTQVGGVDSQIAHSTRTIGLISGASGRGIDINICCTALITTSAPTDHIRAYFRSNTSGRTSTVLSRSLFLIKISN